MPKEARFRDSVKYFYFRKTIAERLFSSFNDFLMIEMSGASKAALLVTILIISTLLALLFLTPSSAWISGSLERLNLVGSRTSLEIVAVTGLGTDSLYVYVRNLGPGSLSLGSSAKQRDPTLWQVFIGEKQFKVMEVQELEKEDNVLDVDELLRLKLEGQEISGSKIRVKVYGPGATMAEFLINKP